MDLQVREGHSGLGFQDCHLFPAFLVVRGLLAVPGVLELRNEASRTGFSHGSWVSGHGGSGECWTTRFSSRPVSAGLSRLSRRAGRSCGARLSVVAVSPWMARGSGIACRTKDGSGKTRASHGSHPLHSAASLTRQCIHLPKDEVAMVKKEPFRAF